MTGFCSLKYEELLFDVQTLKSCKMSVFVDQQKDVPFSHLRSYSYTQSRKGNDLMCFK